MDYEAQMKVCVKNEALRENFQKKAKKPFHAHFLFSRTKKKHWPAMGGCGGSAVCTFVIGAIFYNLAADLYSRDFGSC